MGVMYAWATPDYILNRMSLEQVMLYYSKGWNSKKRGAVILWGVLGQALQGKDPEGRRPKIKGIQGLEEFKKENPGEILESGAWRVSR